VITTCLRIIFAFLLCVLSFLVGQSSQDSELARVSNQRDKAIEAAQSIGAAFNSLHRSFESMEATANRCIDKQKAGRS
jgi:hypothetical protein